MLLSASAFALEWKNVDAEHYLGGRKSSAGYLQGKVVMVCLWKANDKQSQAMLSTVEDIWRTFKTKQFVVLGVPVGDGEAGVGAQDMSAHGKVSFSVYRDAGLQQGHPQFQELPFLYVVNETGNIVYRGRDDRLATQALVTSLTDMASPRNLAQWRKFLNYELDNLPCRGFLRLKEFRKQFPNEAREFVPKAKALLEIPNLKKVSELVEFALMAKDPPVFGPKQSAKKAKYRQLVEEVISKCDVFKAHPDSRVAQEAKNAIADLRWALAAL